MATTKKAAEGTGAELMVVNPITIQRVMIRVEGDSLLCIHHFGEKARKMMLDAMQGIKAKKEPKDPEAEYNQARYLDGQGRDCIRAISFKGALVDAATQYDKSLTKVFLRGVLHIPAELLPIEGVPVMREDVCRVGMGTADLRYRPTYDPWAVEVPVRFNSKNISIKSLVELFNMAGFSCGVGEYRPQKDGNWGMFHVAKVSPWEVA